MMRDQVGKEKYLFSELVYSHSVHIDNKLRTVLCF